MPANTVRNGSPPHMPDHIGIVFRDAIDNILFAKRQRWRVTNYAVAIYAAVFFISTKTPFASCGGKTVLTVLIILVLLYSIYAVWKFQSGIKKFRDRITWIENTYFSCEEREALHLTGESRPLYSDPGILIGLMAVSVIGAGIVLAILWSPSAALTSLCSSGSAPV